ncbi:phosphotransferase [Shouchella patagoniensis]|uniref:phosphotransferase n=1 Tax=Shouchella patagoniensis TaxID=228576 RepID=UPI000995DAF3|nr:phosphotransferase [Shouchella patagoniensis]
MNKTNLSIEEDIFATITNKFGIKVETAKQIHQGYQNLKWQLTTDQGHFFVKQYNQERYPKESLSGLEASLQKQSLLYENGIPCPKLYSNQGKYVIESEQGERFVMMGLCDGRNIKPGTATANQMYSLGQTVGRMHQFVHSHVEKRALHWDVASKRKMMNSWKARYEEAARYGDERLLTNLEIQRSILEASNTDLFSRCIKGWAHWDLFVDNLLFNKDRITAILDFDRTHYVYLDFDISRPILSCCLKDGVMGLDSVAAFVEGYREYRTLTLPSFVRSLQLTWWKEAEWVRIRRDEDSSPLIRFAEENGWVGKHWYELEELFSGISN